MTLYPFPPPTPEELEAFDPKPVRTTVDRGTVLAENVGGFYRAECVEYGQDCGWEVGADTLRAIRFAARHHAEGHLDEVPARLVSVLVLRAVELVEIR